MKLGRASTALARAAAGVAAAASEPATWEERAGVTLVALRPIAPFVCAQLAYWDPLTERHRDLVNLDYPQDVARRLTSADMETEIDELGQRASGRPMRMRDVPPGSLALERTIDTILRPSGFREGLTMCLRTVDGRHVGLLNLSTDDARHPSTDARDLIGWLNVTLASTVDVAHGLGWLHRLIEPDVPAIGLSTGGSAISLPGVEPGEPLTARTGVLASAHRLLARRPNLETCFLWPKPTARGWYRVKVIPCREEATPGVAAVVTALEDDARQLTRREIEVLTLITEGLSNREIAELLVVTRRTVATHTERILQKLGVGNRSAAAAVAIGDGLWIPERAALSRRSVN